MQPEKNAFTRSYSQSLIPIRMNEDNLEEKKNTEEMEILKIINTALNVQTAKKNFSKNNYYTRDDLLLKTKENSIMNFLNSLQNKSISKLKDTFFSKINENNKEALLKISDYKNSLKDNMLKYDLILEENKKINKEISNMNNVQRQLTLELRKSQNTISQMQITDQSLREYKLLYDEFLKYYPGKDPVNQMKDLQINKNTYLNKFNEFNDLQRKLEIENKENQRRLDQEKKVLQNTKEKYNRILESNNMKKMENKMILEELNNEKKTLQNLKEDNNKYRKMLFNLYTKLLQAFKLNKKIKIAPKYLNLTEKDFYPDIMDDMEIFSYIKSMINNINPSEKDKALKQTIAYSNMITRIYLKNKTSLRYDPLNIFKELKNMMEEKEQKIIKLSDKVKDFEIKMNNMELENKKLNNLLIHFNQERIKNLSNKSLIRAQRALRRSTVFNLRAKQKRYGLSNNHNKTLKRPKTGIKYNKKTPEDKKRNKSMDEKENGNENGSGNYINNDNVSNNKTNEIMFNKFGNAEITNKMSKINLLSEMKKRAKNKWLLDNIQMKEFQKIKESRNKDKILKIHNQEPFVRCLNEFNRLIKQTNKLFVYKYKISPKDRINNNRLNMANKFLAEKKLKKSKSMEEFKNANKTDVKTEKDDKDNELGINIENKINELIKNLQSEKLKFNFPSKI